MHESTTGRGADENTRSAADPVRGGQGQPSDSDTGTVATDGLVDELGRLARELASHRDPEEALEAIVRAAVEMVPGTEDGSITVVVGRRDVSSEVPTSDLPRVVDRIQQATGQGPCLDAVYRQRTVRVADMTAEDRWPAFADQAAAVGVRSMLSVQLYVQQDNLGALNLFSRKPNAFSDESEHVGLLFASHAALAYAATRTESSLRQAVDTRDLIGQAKGILMERYQIDAHAAFGVLVRYSQNTHRKLAVVAGDLVRERTLPTGNDAPDA